MFSKEKKKLINASWILLAMFAAPAYASNLLINGSFDEGGQYGSLGGWESDNVDRISAPVWVAHSAPAAVDTNGSRGTRSTAKGWLQQSFTTNPGSDYVVTFQATINSTCGLNTKSVTVSADGQSATMTRVVTEAFVQPPYSEETFTFTADDGTATLRFEGESGDWQTENCGVIVDTVSVVEVSNPDTDGDGVFDDVDVCPETPEGATTDGTGCSVTQICPCDGFNNHGQFQSCTVRAVEEFIANGLLSEEEGEEIASAAARSACGKPAKGKGRK